MMLQFIATVLCLIFGCSYALSPAEHYAGTVASIRGKTIYDFIGDLGACAEMDYPEEPSIEDGMGKCILDVVQDLCPEGTCSPLTMVSLFYVGWYKVEEKKECVNFNDEENFVSDPSCHIRIKTKFASASPAHFDLLFWFLYDPEVPEMNACNDQRSLQSPVSQKKRKNLRTRGKPPPPPPPPENIPLNKKSVRDNHSVEKINEAIMKSRDSGIFSHLKRKLRRFNRN
ncbi:Hypothetical predicted protein [Mytilus galloprovincialis]|uniref:Uncharacterized protein n=1 Tax=Mytilus galloprovincialis TaxID=29158 RepID=A0A8B6E7L2_MYTGA|nr:Hypothetical predicted protein [Mytilus galloprovincialis]